jgi:hypothetical protein
MAASRAGQSLEGDLIRKASESPLGNQSTEDGLGGKTNWPENTASTKKLAQSTRARSHSALQSESLWLGLEVRLILPW